MDDDAQDLLNVQNSLRGDPHAFESIVDRYTSAIYTLAFRMLRNGEEAEDAVQEIFLRAYQSLHTFRLNAKFYSWLYTIAVNTLRTILKKQKKRRREITLPDRFNDEFPDSRTDTILLDPVVARDEYRRARKAIDVLKPKYRIVFVMHYDESMKIRQIADVLDLPVNTVKVRLHRARKILAERLSHDEV